MFLKAVDIYVLHLYVALQALVLPSALALISL